MGDKLTYSDVCHIIMPIIGYYGLYSDKDMVELKKDLGLGLLEFKLNKEFNGKYVYGAKGRRDSDLERAITDYIRDEKIIVYYDEENKKGATKLMLNQNECREEIKKLYFNYFFLPGNAIGTAAFFSSCFGAEFFSTIHKSSFEAFLKFLYEAG